jgi:hypothetical protein
MDLPKSERSIRSLKAYLRHKFPQYAKSYDRLKIRHHSDADSFNRHKKPRYFCFTVRGSNIINCSIELEYVPERIRTAILLHEIGHIIQDAFGTDEAEVHVDFWCASVVPGTGYKMLEKIDYVNSDGETKTAKAVESVSPNFLSKIGLGE